MPQGSRLGPLSFIVMIDDLRANCEVHKFVDDTTLTEPITPSYSPSNMSDYLSSLLIWTTDNDMQLNTFKTKEMILGRTDLTSIPSLSTPAGPIQRVTTFKLLGLHLNASLSWTTHINTIISKAGKRLYFLKQLKRAGVPPTTPTTPFLHYSNPPSSRVCLPSVALLHHTSAILPTGINPKTSSTCHLQWHPWHVISQHLICCQLKFT